MAANFNPLSYGVDGLRSTLAGIAHYGIAIDLVVLSALMIVLLGISTYLFSKIQM